jgi:hypothetical protein
MELVEVLRHPKDGSRMSEEAAYLGHRHESARPIVRARFRPGMSCWDRLSAGSTSVREDYT